MLRQKLRHLALIPAAVAASLPVAAFAQATPPAIDVSSVSASAILTAMAAIFAVIMVVVLARVGYRIAARMTGSIR